MATEKNAVERAIRPAWRPGAGSAARFLARVEGLGRPHRGVGGDRRVARRGVGGASGSSGSGVSGVSKLGLSRYSRRPPGAGSTPLRHSIMANIASQKKRILRSERERTENRLLTSTVKTHFRRLESAVEGGDAERDRGRAPRARLADRQGRAEGRPAQEHRRPQEVQSGPDRRRRLVRLGELPPPRAAARASAPARRRSRRRRGTRPRGRRAPRSPAQVVSRRPQPATSCLAA